MLLLRNLNSVTYTVRPDSRKRKISFRTRASDNRAANDLRSFSYIMAILKRHNLIAESIWPRTVDRYDAVKNPNPKIEVEIEIEYSMSEIGLCFVIACKQPHSTVVT
jgi:hypothetical protein